MTQAIADGIAKNNNITLLSLNKNVVALFALEDEVREGVTETVSTLREGGVKEFIMLTGDNEGVAKKISQRMGIDSYRANLLPEQKLSALEEYVGKEGRTVAMVGDGVNDAAVLTRADVGIAMGGIGTDVAIESADVVLVQDNFKKIAELQTIAKKVLSVARQNFTLWAVVNAIGLYFVFSGVFDPSKAAAYNFLTDFIPIANSLRLIRFRA
ncbi:hypothetical protein AUJ77_03530 [Candidatus Nomurabacteria bacterium CG1_02_43_90]|uniref:Cation-transporting P-type ATPase C-terminal domain-containing protein n=1 Tax=Candidatus Nomurabacteria bacterium CG1_02_43_90 TaxID=1805281 RepID=A0A1J4V7M9_9BACT|nr:MAG: hypothetical protein AUJ77_03530 [Candidatus Nomurabacteria bacterium CG1_02_43_90]